MARVSPRMLAPFFFLILAAQWVVASPAIAQVAVSRSLSVVTDPATLDRTGTIGPGDYMQVHIVVTEPMPASIDGWSGAQFKVDLDPRLQIVTATPSPRTFFNQAVGPHEWLMSFSPCIAPNQMPFTLLTYVVQLAPDATSTDDLRVGLSDLISYGEPMLLAHCSDPTFLELAANMGGVILNPSSPSIVHFSASEKTLVEGRDLHLVWSTFGATDVALDGVGQPTEGGVVVHPQETTAYELTASSGGTPVSASVTVEVIRKPRIDDFTVEPAPGGGSNVKLSWSVTAASSVELGGSGSVWPIAGTLMPESSGPTWTLTATNEWGTTSAYASLGGSTDAPPVIGSFTVWPTPYFPGDPVTLEYEVSNADNVTLDQGIGAVDPVSGSIVVYPEDLVIYTLTATNSFGTTTSSVTALPGRPVVQEFEIIPAGVLRGGAVTVRWRVDGADEVTILPDLGSVDPDSGEVVFRAFHDERYELTATNSNGRISLLRTVTILGRAIQTFEASPLEIFPGEGVTLQWEAFAGFDLSITPQVGHLDADMGSLLVVPPADSTIYTMWASTPDTTLSRTAGPIVWQKPTITLTRDTVDPLYQVPFQVTVAIAGADSATFDPLFGSIDPSGGEFSAAIEDTTEFVVTAMNRAGTSTALMSVAPDYSLPSVSIYKLSSTPVAGKPFYFRVDVTAASSLTIEPIVGTVSPVSRSYSAVIVEPTTFYATASNMRGTAVDSMYVFVASPLPDVTITASTLAPFSGREFTLTVTAAKADSLVLEPSFGSIDPTGGSFVTSITEPSTFTVTGFNSFGQNSSQVEVGIETRAPATAVTLLSSEAPFAGQTTALRTVVARADSAWVEPEFLGLSVTNGTIDHNVSFDDTTHVVLTASNPNGISHSEITVAPRPPVAQLSGDESVEVGELAHLQVTVEGAQSVTLMPNFGVIGGNGNYSTVITAPTDFTLTATNPVGSTTATHHVAIAAPKIMRFEADPDEALPDVPVELSWIVAGADSLTITDGQGFSHETTETTGAISVTETETRTYALTAFGPWNSSSDSLTVSRVPFQIVEFAVLPQTVVLGQPATLIWEVVGSAQVNIAPFGEVAMTGTMEVMPDTTTTYVLTATHGATASSASATLQIGMPGNEELVLSWSPTEVVESAPQMYTYVPFTFYVHARGVLEGMQAYEFGLSLGSDVYILDATSPYPNAINMGNGHNWIIGTGECVPPGELVPLLEVSCVFFNFYPTRTVELRGSTPSSFQNGEPGFSTCAGLLRPFRLGEPLDLWESGGGDPTPVLTVDAEANWTELGPRVEWQGPHDFAPETVRILRQRADQALESIAVLPGASQGSWVDAETDPGQAENLTYQVLLEAPDLVAASDQVQVKGDAPPVFAADRTVLLPNIPNPFNPSTELRFNLSRTADAQLDIYDPAGHHVWGARQLGLSAGVHSVTWMGRDASGRSVASGVYIVRLTTGDVIDHQRIVLMK